VRQVLRLFREFRELEHERDRNIELQTRMAEQSRFIDYLKDELKEARRGELRATQTIANYAAQLQFRSIPFPESPTIAEEAVAPADLAPIPQRYVSAAELVAKNSRSFMDKLKEQVQKMNERAA
jgi:hypothetical protein